MSAEKLLDRLDQLPPMPDVCLRLGDLINNPDVSSAQVARLIEQDASLTARLLRVANSAFYSTPGGISSVQRAITTLGFSTVHQLVLCAISRDMLERAGTPIPPAVGQHNQAVSVLSHSLAKSQRVPKRDVAMAAGLLHDVGRMAFLSLWPEGLRTYVQAVRDGARHSLALERKILGVDHVTVAAQIGVLWKYPEALREAIEHHHLETDDPDVSRLSDIVAVADAWAHDFGKPGLIGLEDVAGMELLSYRANRVGLTMKPPENDRPALQEAVSNGVSI